MWADCVGRMEQSTSLSVHDFLQCVQKAPSLQQIWKTATCLSHWARDFAQSVGIAASFLATMGRAGSVGTAASCAGRTARHSRHDIVELIDLRNVEAKSTSGVNMEESTSPPQGANRLIRGRDF